MRQLLTNSFLALTLLSSPLVHATLEPLSTNALTVNLGGGIISLSQPLSLPFTALTPGINYHIHCIINNPDYKKPVSIFVEDPVNHALGKMYLNLHLTKKGGGDAQLDLAQDSSYNRLRIRGNGRTQPGSTLNISLYPTTKNENPLPITVSYCLATPKNQPY